MTDRSSVFFELVGFIVVASLGGCSTGGENAFQPASRGQSITANSEVDSGILPISTPASTSDTTVDRSPQAVMARQAELERWIADGQAQMGHLVVATQVLDNGQIVDWVDKATVRGAGEPPPDDPSSSLPDGAALGEVPRLVGPTGALPYIRPSFDPYVEGKSNATSVEQYFRELPHGHPIPNNDRMYATVRASTTNYGVAARINNVWGGIDVPSSPDFVITELASFCVGGGGAVSDLVGVINGRLPGVYSTFVNHVFGAEYFAGGAAQWIVNGAPGAYVQVSPGFAPGTNLPSTSTVGGTQFEYDLAVVYRDNVPGYPAAWWLRLNLAYVGYIPASTFTTLGTSACIADFYGEALDLDHASTPWMDADMGNGTRPPTGTQAGNYQNAAYIRLPTYYTSKNLGTSAFGTSLFSPTWEFCYDARRSTDGGANWNPTLWFGGPGGDGLGCNGDPVCATGILSGDSCCAASCGTCGGSGCTGRPGGFANCCTAGVASTPCGTNFPGCKVGPSDPDCITGVLDGTGTYCCALSCGTCGGGGCSSRPGGFSSCCTAGIDASGALCSGSMPPCKADPLP
jgi:hypothetical protein